MSGYLSASLARRHCDRSTGAFVERGSRLQQRQLREGFLNRWRLDFTCCGLVLRTAACTIEFPQEVLSRRPPSAPAHGCFIGKIALPGVARRHLSSRRISRTQPRAGSAVAQAARPPARFEPVRVEARAEPAVSAAVVGRPMRAQFIRMRLSPCAPDGIAIRATPRRLICGFRSGRVVQAASATGSGPDRFRSVRVVAAKAGRLLGELNFSISR